MMGKAFVIHGQVPREGMMHQQDMDGGRQSKRSMAAYKYTIPLNTSTVIYSLDSNSSTN
jgi:hypothetical protein